MVLNITLLKVDHTNEHLPDKLNFHIKECDVFSPEFSCCDLEEAKRIEQQWRDAIGIPSVTRYPVYGGIPYGGFKSKLMQRIFEERKPMVIHERFCPAAGLLHRALHLTFLDIANQGFDRLLDIGIDDSVEQLISSLRLHATGVRLRDQHIARTLTTIENRIVEQYPHLSQKEAISLTLSIGADHNPERFSEIPINVVNLFGDGDMRQLAKKNLGERREDYNPRDLLAYAYASLLDKSGMRVNYGSIGSSGLDQIKAMIRAGSAEIRKRRSISRI